MRLIDDWPRVLRRAWSVRFIALAAVLSGLEFALPLISDVVHLPRGVMAGLFFVVSSAALVARFVAQPRMHSENGRAD